MTAMGWNRKKKIVESNPVVVAVVAYLCGVLSNYFLFFSLVRDKEIFFILLIECNYVMCILKKERNIVGKKFKFTTRFVKVTDDFHFSVEYQVDACEHFCRVFFLNQKEGDYEKVGICLFSLSLYFLSCILHCVCVLSLSVNVASFLNTKSRGVWW